MKAKSNGIIWVASYYKSGNTWVRCLIASLLSNGAQPNLNQLSKICTSGASRSWLEDTLSISTEDLTPDELTRIRLEAYRQQTEKKESICYLKVHDLFDVNLFRPEFTAGIIYIVRDPRDIVSSLGQHLNITLNETIRRMNLKGYGFNRSIKCYLPQTPYISGSWSDHVEGWLNQKESPFLLLRYEDLLANPEYQISRLAEFLGINPEPALCKRAALACRFDALQQAEPKDFDEKPRHMERFFRQGKAGIWQEALTQAQIGCINDRHGEMMLRLGYKLLQQL